MHDPTITQQVRQAVVRALQLEIEPDDLDDDEPLFGETGADSIASLELVFVIEDEFGIVVEDEELGVELFDSVGSLTQFVQEKLAAMSAQETGP